MRDFLVYLDARLKEGATWASISVALLALHINVDPGMWQQITSWGMVAAVTFGVLLKDAGTKSFTASAFDTLQTFEGSAEPLLTSPPAPAVPTAPASNPTPTTGA